MTAALQMADKQDWTTDDLASLPEDLLYELIDGRLILPSPTGLHQILGVEVVLALRQNCPADYAPTTDLSLSVDRHNEPRPDVLVLPKRLLRRSPAPIDQVRLVVEMVSPTSHYRDMHAKARVYAAAGIQGYWVIDPTFEHGVVLTEFRTSAPGAYDIVTSTSKIFRTEVPYPVTLDLQALTAIRDDVLAHEEA